MIRRNVLRRLEQIETALLPQNREVLKIVVTEAGGGVIDELELDISAARNNRWPYQSKPECNPTRSR